ncbi:WXG100 family type VII secretion target [Tumebacillus sp. DT12]|uniref:WXG100 family type VII secretion target n=1 Tax=Tumebacillus lacus TaxID=2995335 RepID=A0ABT3WXC3_9BACL|nr:WXG100 family type VII secretion target [Tumebacillus lacus]MCX7569304.1 WXG100 family type VII secretion target [Tumebacillus lacus]
MITADPHALRYGANRFAAAAQEMQRNADRLMEATNSARIGQEGWSGEGAQSFQLRSERLAADVKQASNAFSSVANTLSRFAMRMERVLELRLRADRLDQQAFEYSDDTLDSIHTRQHIRHQAAQLRHQADSEAGIADSQASAEFQMIAKMIPATLIPGADTSVPLLDGLPKHWQDYYRRHPELLDEEKVAPKLTMGSFKRADEVGVKQYVEEHQHEDPSMLEKIKGFIAGGVDGEKELLIGLISAVSHPIETLKGIAYAVTHPDVVIESLVRKKDEFVSDWQNGNTYGWSKTFHEMIWSVIGLKGAGAGEEGAEVATRVAKSNIELFGNILNPAGKVVLSDGSVIRVSDRVIQSNEELLSFFKRAGEGDSGKLTQNQIDVMVDSIGNSIKNHPLRQEYENSVKELSTKEQELRAQGLSNKEIAGELHQARRDLGLKYKDLTPPDLREYIYEINKGRYGDPLGPTFNSLLEKNMERGLSTEEAYQAIIQSSYRPNPDVDKLLGGFKQWLLKKNGL